MIPKAKHKNFSIIVRWSGNCPHCGADVEIHYNGSPYTAIAEDPVDEQCEKCEEFFTLNFYEDEED